MFHRFIIAFLLCRVLRSSLECLTLRLTVVFRALNFFDLKFIEQELYQSPIFGTLIYESDSSGVHSVE